MPERIRKLQTLVEELEQELHRVESLDDDSRAALQRAAADIQQALKHDDPARIEHESLSGQLNGVVSEFESEHPTVYAVVNRMLDVLGQMGI